MEIKEYNPLYKQAIIDQTKRDINDPKILEFTKLGLETETKHCLIALEEGKFKGYLLGYPVNKDICLILHWSSRDKRTGVKLGIRYLKMIKALGYKYYEYCRDDKYIRRRL